MKKLYFFTALFLCLLILSPSTGQAGFRSLDGAAICPQKQSRHKTNISLQYRDQKRIDLAGRLSSYLEDKGQNPAVITAIYRASLTTDVDFELLIMKAMLESDLGRLNAAATSSARGVFQYIEPTWLTLIKRYGEEIGYPHYANAVGMTKKGRPYIKDKNAYMKAEILALRHDADISALIKAYQIIEETDVIRGYKKARVTSTDHYIAHMLGLSLAKEFYALKNRNSGIAVAKLHRADMREAARLNKPFFYKGKRALTARASYKQFEKRVAREYKKIYTIAKTKEKPTCGTRRPVTTLVKAQR